MAKYYRDRIPETREKNRLYYAAHKDEFRVASKARAAKKRAENAELVNAYKRTLYLRMSPEARQKMNAKCKVESSLYRARHPDRVKKSLLKYRKDNAEIIRERSLMAYKENAAQRRQSTAEWRRAHPERVKIIRRKYSLKNGHKISARNAARERAKLGATPAWGNQFFIEEAYDLARLRSRVLGYKWHVDHIVPLRSKIVCGLHVENNLRVIPAVDNMLKGNRSWPDMPNGELLCA